MTELSQADQFLLDGIRRGDAEAWSQLVDRYRGRLLAFARSRLRSQADAEDLLQDTFMTFLKALPKFRGEAGIETYLFVLLRRRLVDWFRGRRLSICLLQDVVRGQDPDGSSAPEACLPSPDLTASAYARQREMDDLQREALARAIRELINGYKKDLRFRDLEVVEMLFYCQLANKEVAGIAGIDEKKVALIKHRCLKKITRRVARGLKAHHVSGSGEEADVHSDAMLTEVWESLRLSCPKRSTIGAYLLDTLDGAWRDYVDFHLHKLGCQFCRANLDDLQRQTADEDSSVRDRILESTVGFLHRSYLGTQGKDRR